MSTAPLIPVQTPGDATVAEGLQKAREITLQIFGNLERCEEAEDVECPGDQYFQLHVQARGSQEEIRGRAEQWHQQVSNFPPSLAGMFRLTIDVVE